MMSMNGANLTCPNCRQPFQANLEQIIDVGRDPTAKNRLLSGDALAQTCPHCGFRFSVNMPLMYHDPSKDLLMVYVPMELNLPNQEQERLIGSLLNSVMRGIPNEQRRGYLLQPRTVLTMQGLLEQVLQADGITREMIEEQQNRMRFIQMLLQTDDEALPGLVSEHDERIDLELIDSLIGLAEGAMQDGRQDVAEHILATRERLIELSSAGKAALQQSLAQEQAVENVFKALEGLGEEPTLADFVDLVISFADDEGALQVLVGMQRAAFSYGVFQELATRLEQASGDDLAQLEALRTRLLELTNAFDEQRRLALSAAANVLRDILSSPDISAAVQRHLPRINEDFLAVLSANIQAAEENKDIQASARLKQVYETVMQRMQESAPPAVRFVGELLNAAPAQATTMLQERAAEFGPQLLETLDMITADLLARGDQTFAQRLIALREEAATFVGEPEA